MRISKSFLVALAMASACVGMSAQMPNLPADERKGYDSIKADELRADIAYLASDKLEGRMSLQAGDEAAVRWIAAQFGNAGLDAIATKANGMPTYEQSFGLIEYRPDRENSSVTLTRNGTPTVWHAPQAFGAYKHAVNLTAPVVFAGYGITAPELHYDDYKDLDVTGKIVLIFDHEPQEDNPQSIFNGTGNTRYATSRVKLLNAQAHGAVAVVIVPEPNRKHLTNAERAARIGGSITRQTPLPVQAIEDDELSIPSVTVQDDVAKEILGTVKTSPSDLQAKIDADLTPQGLVLPDTTLTLHLINLSERTGHTSNVAGLLLGSDPDLMAETIIISAHHDHDGISPCPAGQEGTDQDGQAIPAGAKCVQTWHGADDNASGTAGVVALARAFAESGTRPRRSVLFVVFAAEERGLLGSYWMAAHPLRPLATTRAMINFDMIGRDEKPSKQTDGLIDIPADTGNRLNLIGALYSPDYKKVVVQSNNGIGLTLDDRFDHDAVLNVLFRSDQFPFLLHNIPAFWWFTGFHPDYHHITDTAEKIDYTKMTKILQLAYVSAWRFAKDDGVPKFIANPEPPPPPPPPAPAEAPAAAEDPAPAAPVPAPVVRHSRPVAPVLIAPTTPAKAAPSTPDASAAQRRSVTPVLIKPTTGEAGEVNTVPVDPQAPSTTPGSVTATPVSTGTGITPDKSRPPVAPVTLDSTGKIGKKNAPQPVTPVKLGGKQPGQDEYEDDPKPDDPKPDAPKR
jgi:hypothetical protein